MCLHELASKVKAHILPKMFLIEKMLREIFKSHFTKAVQIILSLFNSILNIMALARCEIIFKAFLQQQSEFSSSFSSSAAASSRVCLSTVQIERNVAECFKKNW